MKVGDYIEFTDTHKIKFAGVVLTKSKTKMGLLQYNKWGEPTTRTWEFDINKNGTLTVKLLPVPQAA